MAVEKFVNITEKEIKELGVQALADRPNRKSPYGSGGLSPSELKAWFDKLAILLAKKINTLHDTFADPEDAGKYIAVNVGGQKDLQTLDNLITSMQTGDFLKNILIIDTKNGTAPNGVYPFVYLQDYLSAMVIEYRKLDTDTNDVLGRFAKSLKFIYDNTTGKLMLSFTMDSSVYEKTIDLPLESAIVKIEETTNDNGDSVLRLTLASGEVTDVEINAIFKAELSQKVADLEAGLSQKVDTTDFDKVKQELNTTDIRLTNIEARFSDDAVIDSTVAYEKTVPANALPYAEVQRVGGMTYKISPPFSTLLDNGMGTINTDGSITVTNTSEKDVYYNDNGISTENVGGKYFALSSECPYITYIAVRLIYVKQNQETGYFDVNEVSYPLNTWIPEFDRSEYEAVDGRLDFTIAANAGTVTFTPILTDTDDLVPKLIDTKVTELVSEGANLIPFPYVDGMSKTHNGITFTVQEDGTIIANGTATGNAEFVLINESNTDTTIVSPTGVAFTCLSGGSETTYYAQNVATGNKDFGSGMIYKGSFPRRYMRYKIVIVNGYTANNLIFKPMLNRGTTAAPYKPYRTVAVDTFTISAKLRAFLEQYGYGRGVTGAPNEIDFDSKKFYPRVFKGTIPSSSRWTLSNGIFQAAFSHLGLPLINTEHWTKSLSDKYFCTNNHQSRDQVFWTNAAGTLLNIKDTRFSSVDEFNAHLEQNSPSIIYALAEPTEIDISAYLTDDNFIEVEGGGVIRAVNEYEYDAPSTIEYQTEAVE